MNNVSFLFYIADILQNARTPIIFFGSVVFIGIVIIFFLSCVKWAKYSSWGYDDSPYTVKTKKDRRITYKYDEKEMAAAEEFVGTSVFPGIWKWNFLLIPLWVAIVIGGTLIPERNTILLIASSEFAEDFAATPVGGEVGELALDTLKLLRQKLGEELNKVAQ